MNTQATVCNTPEAISHFRLASLRGMVKLEKIGMQTRGGAIRPRIAAELGLKPRDSYEKFLAAIDTALAASRFKLNQMDNDQQ